MSSIGLGDQFNKIRKSLKQNMMCYEFVKAYIQRVTFVMFVFRYIRYLPPQSKIFFLFFLSINGKTKVN